jgi:hypothetical protein
VALREEVQLNSLQSTSTRFVSCFLTHRCVRSTRGAWLPSKDSIMAAATPMAPTMPPVPPTKNPNNSLSRPARAPPLLPRQAVDGQRRPRLPVAKQMGWCARSSAPAPALSSLTLFLPQFPASAKAAASAALPPRPSSARARAQSPSVRDSSDHHLPVRTRPVTAHARPSSHSAGGEMLSATTASAVADIIGAQSSSDEDEPLFENLNARASSALHSELSPRSRAFAHKVNTHATF